MELSAILDFLANFALNNPKLASFCSVAYLVGLGAKIARESYEKFVVESPSKKDDEKLEEIKKKPVVKYSLMVLDFLFRLKKPESK